MPPPAQQNERPFMFRSVEQDAAPHATAPGSEVKPLLPGLPESCPASALASGVVLPSSSGCSTVDVSEAAPLSLDVVAGVTAGGSPNGSPLWERAPPQDANHS